MQLTNKYLIIAFIVAIVLYLFIKKSQKAIKKQISIMSIDEATVKAAFQRVGKIFPNEIKNAERIYRLETAHFKTNNFAKTKGAGFEAVTNNFPFGWTSLKGFWLANIKWMPTTFIKQAENVQKDIQDSGKIKKFIVFPSLDAGIASVCKVLQLRGNDVGAYFATQEPQKTQYRNKILKIVPRYV